MSFSSSKRNALDATKPLLPRMSSLRSCAMLVSGKYGVRRSVIIERIRQLSGIDIEVPCNEDDIKRAIEILSRMREMGWEDPKPSPGE